MYGSGSWDSLRSQKFCDKPVMAASNSAELAFEVQQAEAPKGLVGDPEYIVRPTARGTRVSLPCPPSATRHDLFRAPDLSALSRVEKSNRSRRVSKKEAQGGDANAASSPGTSPRIAYGGLWTHRCSLEDLCTAGGGRAHAASFPNTPPHDRYILRHIAQGLLGILCTRRRSPKDPCRWRRARAQAHRRVPTLLTRRSGPKIRTAGGGRPAALFPCAPPKHRAARERRKRSFVLRHSLRPRVAPLSGGAHKRPALRPRTTVPRAILGRSAGERRYVQVLLQRRARGNDVELTFSSSAARREELEKTQHIYPPERSLGAESAGEERVLLCSFTDKPSAPCTDQLRGSSAALCCTTSPSAPDFV